MKYIILNFVLNYSRSDHCLFLNSIKKRTMVNLNNGDLWDIWSRNVLLPTSLHELFVDRVAIAPNAIALEHNRKVTYNCTKANQMALWSKGLRPNEIVTVSLDRSTDFIAAIFAVLQCGACYAMTQLPRCKSKLNYRRCCQNSYWLPSITQKVILFFHLWYRKK
jgi:non-ribosomal peptide synthetase component F